MLVIRARTTSTVLSMLHIPGRPVNKEITLQANILRLMTGTFASIQHKYFDPETHPIRSDQCTKSVSTPPWGTLIDYSPWPKQVENLEIGDHQNVCCGCGVQLAIPASEVHTGVQIMTKQIKRNVKSWKTISIAGFGMSGIGLACAAIVIGQLLPPLLNGETPQISIVEMGIEGTIALICLMIGFTLMVVGADPFEEFPENFRATDDSEEVRFTGESRSTN